MSNEKKVYFLAPTWDYSPDGGPIQLGNIVTSPETPADPLNTNFHLHSKPPEASLYPQNQKHNLTWSTERHRSGKFGVWSKFLDFISVKFGISRETSNESFYQFERVETREFMPGVEYLREQLLSPKVSWYLETGEPVYMITAVKAVYGAKAKEISAKKIAISAELKAPIGGAIAGASGSVGSGFKTKAAFDDSSPFVFAFRLREVILRKNEISTKEYTKGAMFGLAKPQVAEMMPFCVEGVANADATADAFDLDDGEEVIDDENEECICVIP